MRFFKNLFQKKSVNEPNLQFGRFTDFYKPKEKYHAWDLAVELHHKEDYIGSVLSFLNYLSKDESGNVVYERINPQKINFTIYQGSKEIKGFANEDGFFAEARIARCKELNVVILRSLLEENYQLKYSNYALDSDNNITIVFYTQYLDASPYKLYYGLKEIATRADRRDDVLVQKFDSLEHINTGKTERLNSLEVDIKVKYLKSKVNEAISLVENDYVRLKMNPGLIAYKLLSTAYCMDYLLKPEGLAMEHIENIHRIFFYLNTLNPDQKNKEMVKEMKKIAQLSNELLSSEFYNTVSTFGILSSGNHMRVKEMVSQEMKHFDWYIENGYAEYAACIPQYIASNLFYTYALPLPDKLYLHLLLRIWHNDFFVDLGYKSIVENNTVISDILEEYFDEIEEQCKDLYEFNRIKLRSNNGYDLLSFSKFYLMEIYNLNSKKKN